MSSIFAPMKIDDIGSGRVERRVKINGRERVRGDPLTHADLASMAVANRNAMIENRMITVFPKSVIVRGGFGAEATAAAVEGDYHAVAKGYSKYDVIKGVIVLEGATKDAAAEFIAAEQAKAPVAAPGAAQAATGKLSRAQRASAGKPGRRRKRPASARQKAKPPAPGAAQDNGPIDT